MKLISSYLVIIYVFCSVENFAICAIIAGSNGDNRSATDLFTINYDAVEAQVHISPLGRDLPATVLNLKQGIFLYRNEGNICFIGSFSSRNKLEEPISDIDLYLSKILENIFGADELLLYATEKVSSDDEFGTLRDILQRSCNANQIWWLTKTKPNLPTDEEFMRSRGMKMTEENAGVKLEEDSDKEIRRIKRNAEVERRKFFTSEIRKKKTNKRRRRMRKLKQTHSIQNDDHFEGGVVIEDDIPYISPSFRRKDETGTFRHYLGFNDELEQDSYKAYSEVLPMPGTNNKSEKGENNNENENWINKEASEFQFPKTIVKNGQVFYRHDLNELESSDAETDNHVSEEPQPVDDTVNKMTPFQTFSNDAIRQISGSNKIAQRGFNLLLDQMREIGLHTPITSAAIASAAVKGNSKGSTSHVIGTAMNNGYFAAAARGHDASGTLTRTQVQGSGRGSVGSATVVATKAQGKAFVRVNHNQGGSSVSYSVTQNGETNASAEIDNRPNNLFEETIGQSFGEAGGNIYGSYDDKFDNKVSSDVDQNVNKLGQILPGQVIKATMVDNIIEEVCQPTIHYPTYTQEVHSQKNVAFRDNYANKGSALKNGNLITGYTIIDKGGLLVGAGDPPRESEIQQIKQGILPEGSLHLEEEPPLEPKTEDFSINQPLKTESTTGEEKEFENYSTEQINLDPTYNDSETKGLISIATKFNFGNELNSHGSASANLPYTLETYSPHNAHGNTLQQLEDYHQSAHSFPSHLDVDYIDANQDRFPHKQTTSSSYQGKQNFSTKLRNEIASNIIHGEENVSELHQAFLPNGPIETYAVPEPEPLPISPLAPKNYSAQYKTTIPKNVEPSKTAYDYDSPYYPDYYEPNGSSPSPLEHPYSVEGSYNDNNDYAPSSNFGDNTYQAVPSFDQQIISDLMDKTIPPKQKMVTPSTLILPIIVQENNFMKSNDLLQPGEAGSMQTLEPIGPGEPKIKILTVENTASTREFYQREGIPIQPGEKIPGTPGYRVPQGFRGRVILGHRHPIEVASKRTVKGYNTQVNLQPQIPQTGAVFTTISGTLIPSPHNGNKTGVHITLNSHSTSQNRPRSLDPMKVYSRSSQQLVGPSMPRKPFHFGKYYDQTGDQGYSNRGRHSKVPRNGFQNKECGYFSNDCNKMQGPYQGATICLPIFIEAACCC